MERLNLLFNNDCLEVLKEMSDNSIDSIVTDPPYGIKFMSKKWDIDCPSVEIWQECLRVLKPGGHLLSFSGTRMIDFIMGRIREAGFDVRDTITWLYATGFPKSHNISKGIDKLAGAEREVIGKSNRHGGVSKKTDTISDFHRFKGAGDLITAPSTDQAKQWDGWGTALKPACEFIVMARKPLSEKTIVKNVLKHGTGGLNIDESKIFRDETDVSGWATSGSKESENNSMSGKNYNRAPKLDAQGRWPANLILDEEAGALLDEQSGELKSGKLNGSETSKTTKNIYGKFKERSFNTVGDKGGASRFFYCAKASKSERNKGLGGETKEKQGTRPNSKDETGKFPDHDPRTTGGNNHPTVKPIKLMEYLCKLVTPPNGKILDPFMGSGTTGIAAKNTGFDFIGIEMTEEYFEIAKKRINQNQIGGNNGTRN